MLINIEKGAIIVSVFQRMRQIFMDVYDVTSKFSMIHLYCVDAISFSSYTGVLRVSLMKA